MILDLPDNSVENIIMELKTSSFHFHLTGSRFFGDIGFNSDYDFFTQEDPGTKNFLLNLGFREIKNHYYNDDQIINVFRLRINNSWIDVQLVKNVELKRMVQKSIKGKYLKQYLRMDKIQRRHLWNLLYDVCHKQKEQLCLLQD